MGRFSYTKWAKGVAANILESDLACGFEVADTTPDPAKARAAIEKIITQLKKQALSAKGD
jgi:hypothetical protein